MKLIFLDIDGVLNSNDWVHKRSETIGMDAVAAQYPLYEIDPEAIKRLNLITDQTGAKIVISSTWRHGKSTEALQAMMKMFGATGEIIGITQSFRSVGPNHYTIPRGCEIDSWLKDHEFNRINWSRKSQLEYIEKSGIENYIILDDDSDMLYNQREHFVQTPHTHGLTDELAQKAITILNTSLLDLYSKNTEYED